MPKPAAVTAKAEVNTVRLNEWFINAPPEEWRFILAIFLLSGNGNYPRLAAFSS
jgi:hypothetical protein